MTHRATEQDLRASLEALREEIHDSLCSSVGELISALQGREIQAARQIAARLHDDLHLCQRDRAGYYLSQIVTLLTYEDIFLHCDELTAWLLTLERELDQVRPSRHAASSGLTANPPLRDQEPGLNSGAA